VDKTVAAAIDSVAEVVIGDRKRFHQASLRTPGPDLLPGRWRTFKWPRFAPSGRDRLPGEKRVEARQHEDHRGPRSDDARNHYHKFHRGTLQQIAHNQLGSLGESFRGG
jgi:hypothetical protein